MTWQEYFSSVSMGDGLDDLAVALDAGDLVCGMVEVRRVQIDRPWACIEIDTEDRRYGWANSALGGKPLGQLLVLVFASAALCSAKLPV
jgi:hypothetical protein